VERVSLPVSTVRRLLAVAVRTGARELHEQVAMQLAARRIAGRDGIDWPDYVRRTWTAVLCPVCGETMERRLGPCAACLLSGVEARVEVLEGRP
jgi:hypothetical protein